MLLISLSATFSGRASDERVSDLSTSVEGSTRELVAVLIVDVELLIMF